MTTSRYIKDLSDSVRLEIPYQRTNGKIHFEHEALVYQYNGECDVTQWLPLCDLLSQSEIEELREEISNEK